MSPNSPSFKKSITKTMKRKPPDKSMVLITPKKKIIKKEEESDYSSIQFNETMNSTDSSPSSFQCVSPDSTVYTESDCMNRTFNKSYVENAEEVSIQQSTLRLREVVTIRNVVEQRVVMEMCNGFGQKMAYDADFGFAVHCVMLSIQPPPEPKHDTLLVNTIESGDNKTPVMETIYTRLEQQSPMRILAVRRRRHIIDGRIVSFGPCFTPQFSCGEAAMTVYPCPGDDQYCYGFTAMAGACSVQLKKHNNAIVRDGVDPTKAVRSNVLLLTLNGREFAFEISRTAFRSAYCGLALAAPYTGTVEVHTAFEMSLNEAGQYVQDRSRVVALKTLKCDERFVSQLEFVNSTADLNVHYAQRNSNENPVHEIKAMTFLSKHVADDPIVSRNLIRLHRAAVDAKHLHLMMSYYPQGSLFNYLYRRGHATNRRTSETEARVVVRHLAGVIREMHAVGVAYQDLSAENIIVDSASPIPLALDVGTLCDVQFVLIDMGHVGGHSWDSQRGAFDLLAGRKKCVGKVIYHCPEFYSHLLRQVKQLVLTGVSEETAVERIANSQIPATPQPYSGFQVDSWQFGVLLLCLLTGYSPFDETQGRLPTLRLMLQWFLRVERGGLSEMYVRHDQTRVINGQCLCDTKILSEVASPLAINLMESLLCVNPTDRLTMEQLLLHPWLTSQHG